MATPTPSSPIRAESFPTPVRVVTRILLVVVVLIAGGCNNDEPSTPRPVVPEWLTRPGLPLRITTTDLSLSRDKKPSVRITVDPDRGTWRERQSLPGDTMREPAGRRYWAIQGTGGFGTLAILDTTTGKTTAVGPGWTGDVSPDGAWIALWSELEGLRRAVVEVATGRRYIIETGDRPVHLTWSPRGTLAVAHQGPEPGQPGRLEILSAPDWQPRPAVEFPYQPPVWSPDGSLLAFIGPDGLYVGDPFVWQPRRIAPMPTPESSTTPMVEQIAWSPDGTRVAVTGRTRPAVIDVATGAVTAVVPDDAVMPKEGQGRPAHGLFWSPDGSRLVLVALVDTRPVIVVAHADGSGAYRLLHEDSAVGLLGWDKDGIMVGAALQP